MTLRPRLMRLMEWALHAVFEVLILGGRLLAAIERIHEQSKHFAVRHPSKAQTLLTQTTIDSGISCIFTTFSLLRPS
jgi:hypothetical protein